MSEDEKKSADQPENEPASSGEASGVSGETRRIANAISGFVDHIDALRSTLRISMFMVTGAREQVLDEFRTYAKKYATSFEEDEKGMKASFSMVHHPRAARIQRQMSQAMVAPDLVPRSFVVALVSEYDAFLGKLIKALFVMKPELLATSEKSLTLAELSDFDSIEAAREVLLEREVEAVIRKSHVDQFKWLEKRFGVPLTKDLEVWPTFVELTERRNLFVHADGIVSQQYLAVCRDNGVDLGEVALGDKLSVPPDYFEAAHNCIFEIGVKLGQVLWRKVAPHTLLAADSFMVGTVYHLLANRRYKLSVKLLDFAGETLKKFGSDEYRRMLVINRAQAYKWSGDQNRCNAILEAEDWSACGPQFKLCVLVLKDEFKEACSVMRDIGTDGPVTEAYYEDWPIFREFRESAEFLEAFKSIFGRDFTNIERSMEIERQARLQELEERFRSLKDDEEPVGDNDKG